jgi:hypothetical protein
MLVQVEKQIIQMRTLLNCRESLQNLCNLMNVVVGMYSPATGTKPKSADRFRINAPRPFLAQ